MTAGQEGTHLVAKEIGTWSNPRLDRVRGLVDSIGKRRGKPIRLVPAGLRGGLSGVLISCRDIDYIVYPGKSSPFHQVHVILHEVGHLELGHTGQRALGNSQDPDSALQLPWGQLMPTLSPTRIGRLLARSGYDTDEEVAAELFATVTGERLVRHTWALEKLGMVAPPAMHQGGETIAHAVRLRGALEAIRPTWRAVTAWLPKIALSEWPRPASTSLLLYRRIVEVHDAHMILGGYAGNLLSGVDLTGSTDSDLPSEAYRTIKAHQALFGT